MLIVLVPRGATFIYARKMPVPRMGLRVSLYVTVMIAMFTKCLRQYAINTLERITETTASHVMQYSLNVQNMEDRVDTCVG